LNDNDDIRKRPRPPTRYELVDKYGVKHGPFDSALEAGLYAARYWPDQEQDPDRTGKGWDVHVIGCDQ
jgi:hypothetical protein